VSRNEVDFSEPLSVRAACHAWISFDVASPRRAEVIIEHLHVGKLLARECRPLAVGASALEIKTHPEASHIACLLQAGDRPIDGVRFNVDCGECIERTPRNFIVVGAMKAGTTTLFELLAQHPALCRTWAELPGVSSTKEISYFRKEAKPFRRASRLWEDRQSSPTSCGSRSIGLNHTSRTRCTAVAS
jgi:hypothetical protein